MTYAIQQFHATAYRTIATATDMIDAKVVQSEIKRKAPELPTRIIPLQSEHERKTALTKVRG